MEISKRLKDKKLRAKSYHLVMGLSALIVAGCDVGGQGTRRSKAGADLEPAIGSVSFAPQFGQESGRLLLTDPSTGFQLTEDSLAAGKVAVTLNYTITTDRNGSGQAGSMGIDEAGAMSGTPVSIELPVKKVVFSLNEIMWDGETVRIPDGKISWECKNKNAKLETKYFVSSEGSAASTRFAVTPDNGNESFLCPDALKDKANSSVSPSFTVVRSTSSTGSDSFKTDRPVTSVQGGSLNIGASAPSVSLAESGACMDLNKPQKVDLVMIFKCTSNCDHLAGAGAEANSRFFKRLANENKPKGAALKPQPKKLDYIPNGNFCAPPAQGANENQDSEGMLMAFKFEDAKLTNGKFRIVATFFGNDAKPLTDNSKSASDVLIELIQQKN